MIGFNLSLGLGGVSGVASDFTVLITGYEGGQAEVGDTLTASVNWISPAGTITGYQWQRDGSNISGATAASYTLENTESRTGVSCLVTTTEYGSKASGSVYVAENRFVMVIETTSANETFVLPLHSGPTDITIDMGAGNGPVPVTTYDDVGLSETYPTAGLYTIAASGSWQGTNFNGSPSAHMVREVKNLGRMNWQTMLYAFRDCINMHTLTPGSCDTGDAQNWYGWCVNTGLTHGNTTGLDMTGGVTIAAGYNTTPNMVTFDPTGLEQPGVSFQRYDEILKGSGLPADEVKLAGVNVQGLTTYGSNGYLFGGMFNLIDDPDPIGIDTAIYDQMLLNYAAQNPPASPLGVGGLATDYTRGGAVEAARDALNAAGWVINDAGRLPPVQMTAPSLAVEGPTEITVTFGAPPYAYNYPVDNYDLQWRPVGGSWTEETNVTSPYPLTGLTPGTEYEVQTVGNSWVSDQDGRGQWSLSGTATTTSVITSPGQMLPPDVAVDSHEQLTVTLAADPSNGGASITRRDVRWSIDEVVWTEIRDITSPYAMGSLPASTVIYTQARAVNPVEDDPQNWSTSTARTTAPAPVKPILTNPTAVKNGTDGVTNLSVWTDQDFGTLYWGVYLQGSTPSPTDVANGTGTGHAINNSQIGDFAGLQNISDQTGLSSNTSYEVHYTHLKNSLYADVVTSPAFTTDSVGGLAITIDEVGDAPLITIPDGMESEPISLTVVHGDHGGTYTQDLDAVTLTGTAIAAQSRCLSRVFTSVTLPNDIEITNGFWLEATTNPGQISIVQKIDGVANGQTNLVYQMVQADDGKTFTVDETLGTSTYTSAPYVMAHTPTAPLKPQPPTIMDGPDGFSRYVNIISTGLDDGGLPVESWNIGYKRVSVAEDLTVLTAFTSGNLVTLPEATDYEFQQQAVNAIGAGLWSDGVINSIPSDLFPPVNVTAPSIPATVYGVGQTSTRTVGTWNANPVAILTGNWQRGGIDLPGADSPSYTFVTTDIGTNVRYNEIATNSVGAVSEPSNAVTVVTDYIAAGEPSSGIYGYRKGLGGIMHPLLYGDADGFELKNFAHGGGQLNSAILTFNSPDSSPWSGGEQVVVDSSPVDSMTVTVDDVTGTVDWNGTNGRYEGTITGFGAKLQANQDTIISMSVVPVAEGGITDPNDLPTVYWWIRFDDKSRLLDQFQVPITGDNGQVSWSLDAQTNFPARNAHLERASSRFDEPNLQVWQEGDWNSAIWDYANSDYNGNSEVNLFINQWSTENWGCFASVKDGNYFGRVASQNGTTAPHTNMVNPPDMYVDGVLENPTTEQEFLAILADGQPHTVRLHFTNMTELTDKWRWGNAGVSAHPYGWEMTNTHIVHAGALTTTEVADLTAWMMARPASARTTQP